MRWQLKILIFLLTIGAVEVCSGVELEEHQGSVKRRLTSKVTDQSKKKTKKEVSAPLKAYCDEEDIELKTGKGSAKTGGGNGGRFWWIFATTYGEKKKVGKVYINFVEADPIGEYASIQIFLNKASQGKHIGRWAYKKACEDSPYDTVYAHIRKNNAASIKAAEAAGFIQCYPKAPQVIMKWMRP